jgi:hypothetical protein
MLKENFPHQATIKLDRKSFGFSKSLLGLIPILERFDEDPRERLFTKKEFQEIIENVLMDI